MLNTMIKFYNEHAYTHHYIIGFVYKHNVYTMHAESDILGSILMVDRASRNQGLNLRFKPTNAVKELLINLGAEMFCTEEEMKHELETFKGNKGEWYEKHETEKVGQEWHKDSVPFWEDGDLTVDGIAYQIKFEKATFISTKLMEKLAA